MVKSIGTNQVIALIGGVLALLGLAVYATLRTSSFARYSLVDLPDAAHNRPRQFLGWETPADRLASLIQASFQWWPCSHRGQPY